MNNELFILLVDDDEDDYILIQGMFSRLPGQGERALFHLDWAPGYEEAIRACEQKTYDIYLIDYFLGKRNGLDVMQALHSKGCGAPNILLTGQGSYELDLTAMQSGFADYLVKSQLNEYQLERAIRYALERKTLVDDLERRVQERTAALHSTAQELAQANTRLEELIATLRESEARFRTLTETTSAAIFIVQDQIIRYSNPAVRFVTGYDPDELNGKPLWQIAHASYQNQLRSDRRGIPWAAGIPSRYEIKIIHKSGEERWLDVTTGDFVYEGKPASLLTAFDITERDRAEQELRRAKEELEKRIKKMPNLNS